MQMIGLLAFLFIGMTFINHVIEGAFISTTEIEYINSLIIFREVNVFGIFTLPVPNMEFITVGIPRLLQWDYSFFGGNAAIVQYLLYAITAAVSFMLFTLMIGLLYQYLGRTR